MNSIFVDSELLLVVFLCKDDSILIFFRTLVLEEEFVKATITLSVSPSCPIKFGFISSLGNIVVLRIPFAVVQDNKDKDYQEGDDRDYEGNPEKAIFDPIQTENRG